MVRVRPPQEVAGGCDVVVSVVFTTEGAFKLALRRSIRSNVVALVFIHQNLNCTQELELLRRQQRVEAQGGLVLPGH